MKDIIRKILRLFSLMLLLLLVNSCDKRVTEEEARSVLGKHLEERYGEPFRISRMGRRATDEKVWYEGEIIPMRYVGTIKERDEYYQSVGTVQIRKNILGEKLGTGGDVYMTVRLNEETNAYFLPKLQELFGDKVLPIFQIRAWRIRENGNFKATWDSNQEKGHFYIEGGVYIFTRIDDLDKKEEMRKNLFEFIQYLKNNDMFDMVNLAFYFLDERVLSDRYVKEVGEPLIKKREEIATADEFIKYRKEIMQVLDQDIEQMTGEEINNRLDRFNKSRLREIAKDDLKIYSTLYHKAIRSKKFLEYETRLKKFKKLDFDELDDLKLYNSMKVNYGEYDNKKMYDNEWDGE